MNVLKGIVIFASGVGIGLGIGWIFCRKKMAEKDEAMDELRKYYLEKQLGENNLDKAKEWANGTEKELEEYHRIAERMARRMDETTIILDAADERKEEKEMAEAESPEEEEPTNPYLISEDEYINDKNEYEKISLTYFTIDDTLADDCDEIVDVEETISTDIFNQISEAEDGDYYVRNNTLQTDYEIMKVDQSYKERYGFDY